MLAPSGQDDTRRGRQQCSPRVALGRIASAGPPLSRNRRRRTRPKMPSRVAPELSMIEVINGIEYDLADLSDITIIDVGSAEESSADADDTSDEVLLVYVNVPPGSLD
jgi:hypothetical protein